MIDLNLDMRQYDCPFIATTDEVDVSFSAVQWQLDTNREKLEVRLIVQGEDRPTVENGLQTLQNHRNMDEIELQSKKDNVARITSVIEQTNAMETIQRNDGYITGPFQIEDGSERWHVGFDNDDEADRTLSELERSNEFTVEARDEFNTTTLFDLLENSNSIRHLLDGCRSLTETEQETLTTAATEGYYNTPRETTLSDLADQFDISKTAVSMNLRRGERKVLEAAMEALTDIESENVRST